MDRREDVWGTIDRDTLSVLAHDWDDWVRKSAESQSTTTPWRNTLMELTKENLAWALCSIMDGMKQHEIHEITGLPNEACEMIWTIYRQALSEPLTRPY